MPQYAASKQVSLKSQCTFIDTISVNLNIDLKSLAYEFMNIQCNEAEINIEKTCVTTLG